MRSGGIAGWTGGLARISHQASAAAADTGLSAALRSVGLLDALVKCVSGALGRAPCIHARLHRLATNLGEKCGLVATAALLLSLSVPGSLAGVAAEEGSIRTLSGAGWEESSPGWGSSLPERKAEAGADGSLRGEFLLAPGSSLAWEKRGSWDPARGVSISVELYSEGTNEMSEDYSRGRAHFPVSVTAVFGKDSLDLTLRRRALDFLANLLYGFPPGGIRLTYAWGNGVPAGSMFRPVDEETVLVLASENERGKRVAAIRDLAGDFRAAYGREPKGPVTRFIVRAGRPPEEKGAVRAGVLLGLPAQ